MKSEHGAWNIEHGFIKCSINLPRQTVHVASAKGGLYTLKTQLNKVNMHNYKHLKIWHEAMDLVVEIYSITSDFPKHEQYGLTSQLRRAATSIPSNIAEGTSRRSVKEFKHFLSIALGSSFEVTTQIEIAFILKIIEIEKRDTLIHLNDLLQKRIQTFSNQIKDM